MNRQRRSRRVRPGVLLTALAICGCSTFRAANLPLAHWDPSYGYRPARVLAERPPGSMLLFFAFSGGGTRAAALSYGVLQELRDTEVSVGGRRERLLDEVDMITSVSGGSFTAAYYGLYGDRIFEDFESRFLRRNVQLGLILGLLNPLNWVRFVATSFDRSEMAIHLYDQKIFDHATFADLLAARGPMLTMNATDLAAGYHFTFFQPQFDLLCSDLSSYPVARAVAASSAVPVLFSPLVLRNYAGSCGFEPPAWLASALGERRTNPRRFRAAEITKGYLDVEDRPYVHLLDGGISDNIGLRVPLTNVILAGGPLARLEELGDLHFDRVAIIVVNAEVHPPPRFDLAATAPGLAAVLGSITDTQIYDYNFDTIQLMRERLKQWAAELPPASDGRPVRSALITLGFEDIEDPKERAFFYSVPTSFSLPDKTVDRLVAVARRLLRESPDYQEMLSELRP
jgi:NTE family protein